MGKIKIWQICQVCDGEGHFPQNIDGIGVDTLCPSCKGEKKTDWGFLKIKNAEEE